MAKVKRYAKFVASLAAPVWAVTQSAITDGTITQDETRLIIGAAVASLLVYLVPNRPAPKP